MINIAHPGDLGNEFAEFRKGIWETSGSVGQDCDDICTENQSNKGEIE